MRSKLTDLQAEHVDLKLSSSTGPEAPRYVRACRWKPVGTASAQGDRAAEAGACHRAAHRGYQPNGTAVVMVVKDRVASLEVPQIIMMLPAADLGRSHAPPLQPHGTDPRRPASESGRQQVFSAARVALQAGAFREKARDYLTQWFRATQQRLLRPLHYQLLSHRVWSRSEPDAAASDLSAPYHDPRPVGCGSHGQQ